MIISISGKICSGKDTVAAIIQELQPEMNWEVKKFAGKLKTIASMLSNTPIEKFEDQEFKKLDMAPEWGMTYREFLQRLGTEAMRVGLHENVWVNALFSNYKSTEVKDRYFNWPNWIITDCRFPNELDSVIYRSGYTIKVVRDSGNTIGTTHPSETALDGYTDWTFVIDNNGTIEELKEQVKQILQKIILG